MAMAVRTLVKDSFLAATEKPMANRTIDQMVNRSSEPQRLFTILPLAERAVEASLRYLDR
jgi:hypothetical protein